MESRKLEEGWNGLCEFSPAKGMLEAEVVARGNAPGLSRVYVQGGVRAAALNFMGSSGVFSIGLIQGQIVALSMYTRFQLICSFPIFWEG